MRGGGAAHWRLANHRQPPGRLDKAYRFLGCGCDDGGGGLSCDAGRGRQGRLHEQLTAVTVGVPTNVDARRAFENASVLASDHTRSLELWWDGPGQRLDVVLVGESGDMEKYKRDFLAAYPNATFFEHQRGGVDRRAENRWGGLTDATDLRGGGGTGSEMAASPPPVPEWYDGSRLGKRQMRRKGDSAVAGRVGSHGGKRGDGGIRCYQIFDVGYRHGHVSAMFDTRHTGGEGRDVVSIMAGAIQMASHAWVQTVFRRHNLARPLQSMSDMLRARNEHLQRPGYQSLYDHVFGGSDDRKPHPEKGGDFTTYYSMIKSHTEQKAQGDQVVVSVRGLLDVPVPAAGGNGVGAGRPAARGRCVEGGAVDAPGSVCSPQPSPPSPPPLHLDFSGVGSAATMQLGSFEYLTMNAYRYDAFADKDGCGRDAEEGAGAVIYVNGRRMRGRRLPAMFEGRLLPEPSGPVASAISRYASRSLWGLGGYRLRESTPFVIMTLPELGLLLRLPAATTTPNLAITRQQVIPQQQQTKTGFCLGFLRRERSTTVLAGVTAAGGGSKRRAGTPAATATAAPFYGRPAEASSVQGVVISPRDLQTHLYMVGGTKSGKTTLIRCIAKHMEMANIHGTFRNAFIFVDPKGSDAYDFLRQCEPETYRRDRVMFLDPVDTGFSINVLELPPYEPGKRHVVVSQYVGYIMQMIEYWYRGSDSFVRLRRILDTLLQYIYLHNDKPTFLDMYEIIVAMQRDGREVLLRMFRELGKPESALQHAVESVAGMEKIAYEPALNRLEKFATDPVLRHMFCVRESTVRFDSMIAAGAFTIIRLSPLNIPQHIITLAKQTLIVKLWFAIQERAERVKLERDRTQVLLALDEFQDVAGLPVIEAMLTQSRSYGLGLLLAHQTTTQLNDRLFEIITGNAGTQFVGRVTGRDGGRFGDAWDPKYARELKEQLATQEYHHWTVRPIAGGGGGGDEGEGDEGGGDVQPLPVQFWPVYTEKSAQTGQFLKEFMATQRKKFGTGVVGASMLTASSKKANKWLESIPSEPPSRDEWEIMCIMAEAGSSLRLKDVVQKFRDGTTASDAVSAVLRGMVSKGLMGRGGREAGGTRTFYWLPYEVREKHLMFDSDLIGTAEDIPALTAAAVRHYLEHRNFLCVATQTVKKRRYRTDLVAYDYETETPISVEVESAAEIRRHPEHVKLNMVKWRGLGFGRCDVWSTDNGIEGIYENELNREEKEGVRVFVVTCGGGGAEGATTEGDATGSIPLPDGGKNYYCYNDMRGEGAKGAAP